jgi:hypothetical protein
MVKRIGLLCIILAMPAATMPVRAQQDPLRSLQILVEGEPQFLRSIIEALRRNSAKYDLKLEFAGEYGDQYDLRLIVSTGMGSDFSYLTAVALAPDGKLLFTITRPDMWADGAAVQVIRNIYSQAVMPRKQSTPDLSSSQEATKPVQPTTPVKAMAQKSLDEPGVYYKNKADWIRLTESTGDRERTSGGFFGVKFVRIYSAPSAKVQFSTPQPEFYVRGIAVSEQDISILQLERKKDHREVQVGSAGFGYVRGHRPKDLNQVKATRLSDGLYKITPASELKPGEYILYLYSGGYEFGITPSSHRTPN